MKTPNQLINVSLTASDLREVCGTAATILGGEMPFTCRADNESDVAFYTRTLKQWRKYSPRWLAEQRRKPAAIRRNTEIHSALNQDADRLERLLPQLKAALSAKVTTVVFSFPDGSEIRTEIDAAMWRRCKRAAKKTGETMPKFLEGALTEYLDAPKVAV